MALKTCPRCGASVNPARTPARTARAVLKKKSALTPYFIIIVLIVVVVIVVAVVLMGSGAGGPGGAGSAGSLPSNR